MDNTFYLRELEGRIHSIEHWRFAANGSKITSGVMAKRASFSHYDHLAVVVLRDGELHWGWATCSPKDQYSRRYGFRLAQRRALESVWYEGRKHRPVQNGLRLQVVPKKGAELAKAVLDLVMPI